MGVKGFGAGVVLALVGVSVAACGGSSPASPSPGGGPGSAAVTISIRGMTGAQSFSPNPASVAVGQTVRFVNDDSVLHRILQDDAAFDTGNLAPGASSSPITISSSARLPYHCTLHPSMVGAINGSSGPGNGGGGGY